MKRKASIKENSMKREASRKENSDPLPIDIITEILSRSSAKSVARFGLASKFCTSIVNRPDFTDLFLTKSSTRPRLFFAVKNRRGWCFFSSPQPHNPDEKPSLVAEANFNFHLMEFSEISCLWAEICGPVSGLLNISYMLISKGTSVEVDVICNPSTGQYARLPQLERQDYSESLLGYDPIGKQYKLLTTSSSCQKRIMTLGTGKMSWRKINLPTHYSTTEGICINGVLYYKAGVTREVDKIACFDVRHEELSFLKAEHITSWRSSPRTKLINYKGQLGVISWHWYDTYERPRGALKLCLWILEDAQRQEWSKSDYTLSMNIDFEGHLLLAGVVAATGEIIFSMDYAYKPFFVFYFNPESKTLKKVRIKGFEESGNPHRVLTFVDYAEDFKYIR